MNINDIERIQKRPIIGYYNLYSGISSYIGVKNQKSFWKLNSGDVVNDFLIANDIPFKEYNYYSGSVFSENQQDKNPFNPNKYRIRIYYVVEETINEKNKDLLYNLPENVAYALKDKSNILKDGMDKRDYDYIFDSFSENEKIKFYYITKIGDKEEYSILNYPSSFSFLVILKEDSFVEFPTRLKKLFQEYEGGKILATPYLMPKLFFGCYGSNYMFKGVKNQNSSVVIGSNSIFSANSYMEYEDLLFHEGSVFIGDNSYMFYKKELFYDNNKGIFVVDYDKQRVGSDILIGKHAVVNVKYIGDNSVIGNESVLEDYCYIGNNTYIQSGVKISQHSEIGDFANVSVNPNKILGEDYFRSTDANYSEWIRQLTQKSFLDV